MGAHESVCDEVVDLKAEVKTTLPEGSTVMISNSQDKTKWTPPSAPATPCPVGCDEHCRQAACS